MRSFGVRRRSPALLGTAQRFGESAGDQQQLTETVASVDERTEDVLDVTAELVEGDEIDERIAAPQVDSAR